MHEKLLKAFIYITAFICLIMFLSVRIVPEISMNMLLQVKTYEEYEDSTRYGELFYMTLIRDFKEDLPHAIRKYRFSDKHPRLEQADIIIYGDSHFDHSRHVSFPEQLAGLTGKKVYYYRINKPFWGNAPAFLETMGYQPSNGKLFVYGSTERYVPERFWASYQPEVMRTNIRPHQYLLRNVLFLENTDLLYTTILKRGYITHSLYTTLSTLRFRLFKYINSFTPEYHIDPGNGSWLFTIESINHFNQKFSDEDIQTIASNIGHMARLIEERYGLDFVFLPIPERYTLYHSLTGNNGPYNNFLPRLYAELDKLGVNYVNLYDDFIESKSILFHMTDTHWNENGVVIGLENTLEKINGMFFADWSQAGESSP